ncbi:phage tail tape measure protein [Pseudodesulfovibrio senegalensis]|uniref:Phage tail tape measure protein n=1 Tax=Pseudodesulfovibrio senegalensis TaxID=1721087 RepID=A0A6N6N5A9_9BACT|nr:phage tail tape measure protein [Pseudodesulfovibrio senegalensis]KAB1443073.1 phage tail tape measure protein [Pseudodesulfovibrio senegalensis]
MIVGTLEGKLKLDSSQYNRGFQKLRQGFKNIHNQSIKLNQSFELMKNAWQSSADAMVKAFQITERAAKKADLEATFKRLSEAQGRQAEDMVKQMRKVTKGAMSEMDMMANSAQAMMAGMDFRQTITAFQYLQRYAKATNKDFKQLSETIMTGLARGSTLMLDDAGIIIGQTGFIADKERELGRSLSDVEKKTYLVNEAIAQMSRKMGVLGTDTMTTYDHIQKMKAEWQNFVDCLGSIGLKVFGGLKASLLGWKAIFLDTEMAMTKVALAVEKNYGDMVVSIRSKLMEAMMVIRDMLNKTAMALGEYDNAIAQQAAKTASAMSNWFNEGAIALFDANMNTLTGTTKAKLTAHIETLKEKRIELRAEMEMLNKFLLGKTDTASSANAAAFDLSASTGSGVSNGSKKAAEAQINARKAALDELMRVTLKQQEYEKWRLRQDILDFKKNLDEKRITEDQYNAYRKAKLDEIKRLELEASGTIADGWKAGWKDSMKEMEKTFNQGKEMASNMSGEMSGSFKILFADSMKGQLDNVGDYFTNFANSILNAWIDLQAEMMAKSMMSSLMGGLGGGGGFWGSLFGGLFGFAKGGAFQNGKLTAYASGGIVNRPTMFTHSGGLGIMGEAGAEAIMPLTRTRSGDLGVKATGAPHIKIVNNVTTDTTTDAKVTQSQPKFNGEEWVINTWVDAYANNKHGLRDALGG